MAWTPMVRPAKNEQLLCRDPLGKAVDGTAKDVRRHDGGSAGAGEGDQADGHAEAIPQDVRPQAGREDHGKPLPSDGERSF